MPIDAQNMDYIAPKVIKQCFTEWPLDLSVRKRNISIFKSRDQHIREMPPDWDSSSSIMETSSDESVLGTGVDHWNMTRAIWTSNLQRRDKATHDRTLAKLAVCNNAIVYNKLVNERRKLAEPLPLSAVVGILFD